MLKAYKSKVFDILEKSSRYRSGKRLFEVCEVLVFLSANVDEGDAWNDVIMKKYYNI